MLVFPKVKKCLFFEKVFLIVNTISIGYFTVNEMLKIRRMERNKVSPFERPWSVAVWSERRVSRNRTIALLRRQKVQDRPGLRSLLPQPGSRLGQLLRKDQNDHREKLTARKSRRFERCESHFKIGYRDYF